MRKALSALLILLLALPLIGQNLPTVVPVFSSVSSGGVLSDAAFNTKGGTDALKVITTGTYNTAFGFESGKAITTGNKHVAVGSGALAAMVTGDGSTAVGFEALNASTLTTLGNAAFGYQAGKAATTQDSVTALGYGTQSILAGSGNTAVGMLAARNVGGAQNVAVGNTAMGNNTAGNTGSYNIAIGTEALYKIGNASTNIGIGYRALYAHTGGDGNTAIGSNSLQGLTTGTYNIATGYMAGRYQSDGATAANPTQSVYAGANTKSGAASATNEIVIGYNAIGLGSNTITIGNADITKVKLTGTSFALGTGAHAALTTGQNNIAIGNNASDLQTTGSRVVAIGHDAGDGDGHEDVWIGYGTGKQTGGQYNVGIGTGAIGGNVAVRGAVTDSVAVGRWAMHNASGAQYNVAVGTGALQLASDADMMTAVGANALQNVNSEQATAFGYYAGRTASGLYPTAIGAFAMDAVGAGNYNVAVGKSALRVNTAATGHNNTSVGTWSLAYCTTCIDTTAVGFQAGLYLADGTTQKTDSTGNTYVGSNVKSSAASSTNEIVIGYNAVGKGSNTTTIGNANTTKFFATGSQFALGTNALAGFTTGGNNIAIGSGALQNPTTSTNNIGIGLNALQTSGSTQHNVAIGGQDALMSTTGNNNVAVGSAAMREGSSGSNNVGVGHNALRSVGTGSDSVGIGYRAGYYQSDGATPVTSNAQSVYVGSATKSGTAAPTNEIVIGYNAIGRGSNTTTIGNSSTTSTKLYGDVEATLSLTIKDGGAKPTCDSSIRGKFWFDEGGVGVKDSLEVCAKDAGDAYAWRTIY